MGRLSLGDHTQVTEETVWVRNRVGGCPASRLLLPDCSLSPLTGDLRFWKSSLLATDEEAKQTNSFLFFFVLNISTKGSSKEAALCSLTKHPILRRQQLSQEGKRKLVTGVTHLFCGCPSPKSNAPQRC